MVMSKNLAGLFLFGPVFWLTLELGNGLQEGDFCTISSTEQSGVCKLITSCPEAIKNLRKAIAPQICGFIGVQSMVCCAQNSVIQTTLSSSTTTSRTITYTTTHMSFENKRERKPGEIALKKCKEYSKYVYVEEPPVVFKPGAKPITRRECPFDQIKFIVGGTLATRNEFPHMTQIGFARAEDPTPGDIFWGCGGSLISENFILTAAHCVFTQHGDARMVRMGVTNLTKTDHQDHLQQIKVADRWIHPGFKKPAHYNDIGLLKLERNADFDQYVRPACLHTTNDLPNTKVVACGWGKVPVYNSMGKIQYAGISSKELLKVVLELYSNSFCSSVYKGVTGGTRLKQGIREDSMICAGSSKELRDTCQGDSGGPLQVYVDTEEIECMYDIIGITSFGQACGLALDNPGVYTRVSNFLTWIEDIVWSDT